VGATYRHHAFGDFDGIFHIDANYQGKEYADYTNLVYLDPYWMSNMRLGLENHRYKLELYVQNLFNNSTPQAIAQTTDQITGKNVITVTPAQKRVIGVRAGLNF
jgi:outer membrane receptor protein involved in Fe transport